MEVFSASSERVLSTTRQMIFGVRFGFLLSAGKPPRGPYRLSDSEDGVGTADSKDVLGLRFTPFLANEWTI